MIQVSAAVVDHSNDNSMKLSLVDAVTNDLLRSPLLYHQFVEIMIRKSFVDTATDKLINIMGKKPVWVWAEAVHNNNCCFSDHYDHNE